MLNTKLQDELCLVSNTNPPYLLMPFYLKTGSLTKVTSGIRIILYESRTAPSLARPGRPASLWEVEFELTDTQGEAENQLNGHKSRKQQSPGRRPTREVFLWLKGGKFSEPDLQNWRKKKAYVVLCYSDSTKPAGGNRVWRYLALIILSTWFKNKSLC